MYYHTCIFVLLIPKLQKGYWFWFFALFLSDFEFLSTNVSPNITTYYWTPCCMCSKQHKVIRAVGVEGARASTDFGRWVNPILIREQIIPTTLLLNPPGFSDLPTALKPSHGARWTFVYSTSLPLFILTKDDFTTS